MSDEMSVYVCDTAVLAETAKQFLIAGGYSAAGISVEPVTVFNYDAATYSSGKSDGLANKFAVIGRK
jgi:hypothetical protein